MKKFLTYFQYNLKLGIMLLCSVGVVPTRTIQILVQDLEDHSTGMQVVLQADANKSEDHTEGGAGDDGTDPPGDDDNDKEPGGNNEDDPDKDEKKELHDFGNDLIIYAFNPGYSEVLTPGEKAVSNVGEFIELYNLTDHELALAGYSLRYTPGGSSIPTTIFTFPEGSYMTSKHLLLRYSGSPEKDQADLTYSPSLALDKGPLELIYNDEVVDTVCWKGGEKCLAKFLSTNKSTQVRDLSGGKFKPVYYKGFDDVAKYEPVFSNEEVRLIWPEDPTDNPTDDPDGQEVIAPKCQGLEITEILSYYENDKSEQYIEIFNPTAELINLDGCKINFKNKNYPLSGEVGSGKYFAYYQGAQFALTKNPKNPLTLALIDTNDEVVDEMAYPNGQKKSTSYAKIFDTQGDETWEITYAITPGAENIYQKFRSCEEGKIINEATGNCIKVTSIKAATSSSSQSIATLAPCPEGKYRNPLTGRCKNIETTTSSTLKDCAEGYERNPETNRCRKITKANDGAEYALEPIEHPDETVFIGIGIVVLIVILGLVYVVLQFRQEILRAGRKFGQRINHIRQDLFSRKIRSDRDKKP